MSHRVSKPQTKREARARRRSSHVYQDMLRKPTLSFTQAAQKRKVDRRTVLHHYGSDFEKDSSGRIKARSLDRRRQTLFIPGSEPGVDIPVPTKNASERRFVGRWMKALNAARRGDFSETRIRLHEVPVVPVDFTSEYPSTCVLLGLWNILTAKSLSFPDATRQVRKLAKSITLDRCFRPELWPDLRFFALVKPQKHVLPVRTMYDGSTPNIGNNYLTSAKPIWIAGPDLIASTIQTGSAPQVVRAIRVVPRGKQPEMQPVTVTTFNVLKSLHEWEGFRPYNFFLLPVLADGGYPVNVNPERFRLVAPFESDQTKWKRLTCINIGDPKDRRVYGLTTSFTSNEYGRKAVVETFENLFHRYAQHPEAKSLGPDGEACKSNTRGLLGRSHIIAEKHRRIGKESDRRWEEGDDLESLLFVPVEYEQPGEQAEAPTLARASERLIRLIKTIGIRKLVRFGLGRRILENICRRELLKASTLGEYKRRIQEYAS